MFTMPFTFSFEEYADMIYVYGFCDGNPGLAIAEYQQWFPNRRIPNRRGFAGVYQDFPAFVLHPSMVLNEGINEEGIRMVHRSAECATSLT
jgi:hypothetical protein